MRITFVLNGPHLSGGVIAIAEYANQFVNFGHQVTILWPQWPYVRRHGTKYAVDLLRQLRSRLYGVAPGSLDFLECEANTIVVPSVSNRYVPDSDIVIATAWITAEWVITLSETKGKKFYFVQHYETWNGPEERVNRTWTMPMTKIVVSSWLKNIAEQQFGQDAFGPLVHGVNMKQFYNHDRNFDRVKTVGMLYSPSDWKGSQDGITIIEEVRSIYGDIGLVMFSAYPRDAQVPDYANYYYRPSRDYLRVIYSMCDVWLCPSWAEGGPPMPSQEAAACKCAIVTTDVGAVRDVFVDGVSAMVSPPRDIASMVRHVGYLIEHPAETQRIALAGYERMRELTWERAAEQFLDYLSV